MMKKRFLNGLLNNFYENTISFNEPDLVKTLVDLLHCHFPRGVSVSSSLTQSNSKWFAKLTKAKNATRCELGDFILLTKKGKDFKVSFIQAKNCSKQENYLTQKTFRASLSQQSVMSGIRREIYLGGDTPMTLVNQDTFKSVTSYLIFYREDHYPHFYNVDLVCAQTNCYIINEDKRTKFNDFISKTKKYVIPDNLKQAKMKIINKKRSEIIEGIGTNADCRYAETFRGFIKNISEFRVGAILNKTNVDQFGTYLPKHLVEIIKSGGNLNDIQFASDVPIISIDAEKYDAEGWDLEERLIYRDPFNNL